MKRILLALCVFLLPIIVIAAPQYTLMRTILPEVDSTSELGTSTRAWYRIFSDQFCLTGDTCITSWPSGSGSGSGSSFGQSWELYGSGSYLAPTTTKGFIVSASSTIPYLTTVLSTTTQATTTSLGVTGINALGSSGILIESTSGTDVLTLGSGGGSNATFHGGVNIVGQTTLATSLTGLLKATSGVVSTAVAGTDYLTTALTSIGPANDTATGPSITLATSSSPFNGLTASTTITRSTNTLTFTNTLAGLLTAGGGGTGISNPSAAGILLGSYAGGAWQQLATSSLGLLTTNVAEGTNLYYLDSRVQSFIHASTTIPKTYTNNTFTGAQTFSGAVNIGSLNGPLDARNGVVGATTSIGVLYGGTGLTSAPTFGQILVGNASSGYTLTATSSLGLPTFSYLFPSNATSTLLTFTGGVLVNNATSTITNLVMTEATSTNATTTNLSISGTLDVDGLTSALVLTGSTGIFAEYAGTSCTNQFVRSISALGVATCATVSSSDVSLANLTATDSTLTFSGTYNGATARTIGLNLANANVWTASTTFSGGLTAVTGTTTYATSTNLYTSGQTILAGVSGNVGIGTTSPASNFSVQGATYLAGTTFMGATTTATTSEGYSGRISSWRYLSLSAATTTTWTASTSRAYIPFVTAPFTGTIRDVSCTASSTGAFIGVAPYIGTTPTTPSYFVASSTVGRVVFTANNTFSVGQSIGAVFGTTTTDSNARNVQCTFRVTETP